MGHRRKNREQFYRYDTPTHVVKGNGQPVVPNLGTCSPCGKYTYETRANAKRVCKNMKATGDHPVEPYRCPHRQDWWHVGGRRV